ncbi:unnamed protein product [Boreogadus saida]
MTSRMVLSHSRRVRVKPNQLVQRGSAPPLSWSREVELAWVSSTSQLVQRGVAGLGQLHLSAAPERCSWPGSAPPLGSAGSMVEPSQSRDPQHIASLSIPVRSEAAGGCLWMGSLPHPELDY